MSQTIQGTFATGQNPVAGNASAVLAIPYGTTSAKLTTVGLTASNTIKTQKSTDSGTTWADQTTYNSDQTATVITVAANEQWRIVCTAETAITDIRYKLTIEN